MPSHELGCGHATARVYHATWRRGGCLAARGAQQQSAKIARIGYLTFGTGAAAAPRVEAMRAGLRELGYVEGKNILIEFRWADASNCCMS